MSKFEPGDIIVGPVMGERWAFVGEALNGFYAIHENDLPDGPATRFEGSPDGWKLAPMPFFELEERYQRGDSKYVWQCVNVFEHNGGRFANLFEIDDPSDVILWDESHFRFTKKVK